MRLGNGGVYNHQPMGQYMRYVRFPLIPIGLMVITAIGEAFLLNSPFGDWYRNHVGSTDGPVYGGVIFLLFTGVWAILACKRWERFFLTRMHSGLRPRR